MNIKKTLAGIASYVLVGAVAAGIAGSLAYQNDVDADVNTATVGNVSIAQHEYQREDPNVATNEKAEGQTKLVPFKQNQELYPAYAADTTAWTANGNDKLYFWNEYVHTGTAGNGLWDPAKLQGAIDKFVFVENTGTSDLYFRTLLAFECPNGVTVGDAGAGDTIGTNVNGSDIWSDGFVDYITIDGVRYAMFEFIYTDILHAAEIAHPSLLQVAFSDKMTNEQAKLLGDTYEIMVFSQACQTKNMPAGTDGKSDAEAALDAAFGDISAANHPWMETKFAESENDLIGGGDVIVSGAELTLTEAATTIDQPTTITNNGTITADRSDTSGADKFSALTVNSEVTLTGEGAITNTGGYTISVRDEDAVLTIESGTYTGNTSAVNVVKGTLYIKGGTFEDTGTEDNGHYLINCIDANYKNGTAKVVITGGKFKNWNPEDNTSEGADTNFVADGYKVTSETDTNGDVWYTVVAE